MRTIAKTLMYAFLVAGFMFGSLLAMIGKAIADACEIAADHLA